MNGEIQRDPRSSRNQDGAGDRGDQHEEREHRLLPWTGWDGKPCYLSSDGEGLIDALADEMEEMQLRVARELLVHADELKATDGRERSGETELRFLVQRLGESLRDVLRVAESRGARLRV